MELGLPRLKHHLQKLQLNDINQVRWEMAGQSLMEKWRICGRKCTLGQADIIANSYGMPNISEVHLDLQTYIKQMVKRKN